MSQKKIRLIAYLLLLYVILLVPSYYLMHSVTTLYGGHPSHQVILETTPLYALLLLVLIMVPAIAIGLIVWIIKHNNRRRNATNR